MTSTDAVGVQMCSNFTSTYTTYGASLLANGDFETSVGIGGGSVAGPGWTTGYGARNNIFTAGVNTYGLFSTTAGQVTGGNGSANLIAALGTKSIAVNVGPNTAVPLFEWLNIPLVNGKTYDFGADAAAIFFPFGVGAKVDGVAVAAMTGPTAQHTWTKSHAVFTWTGTTGNHAVGIYSNNPAAAGNDLTFDNLSLRVVNATPGGIMTITPPDGGAPGNPVPTITALGGANYQVCYTPSVAGVRTFTIKVTDVNDATLSTSQDVVFTALVSAPAVTKTTAGATTRYEGNVITSTVTLTNPAPAATGTLTARAFSDPIPAAPTGTTRAYTSTVTGGATGNTAVGVGAIADTVTIPVNGTIVYTINDTVLNTGTYKNTATLTGVTPASGTAITIDSKIVAVADNYATMTPNTTTPTSVLTNDTADGVLATIGASGNVLLTPGTSPLASIVMLVNGKIFVDVKTPPGVYVYPYKICSKVTAGKCANTTATLTVLSVIDAVDENFGSIPNGGTTPTVITNDTLNGNPAEIGATGNVTLTPGTSPNPGLTMNSDGTISVSMATPFGVYQYPYKICSKVDPATCDTAIATLKVPAEIDAVVDDFGYQTAGTNTPTVLTNDTLNNTPFTVGVDVKLTPGTSPNAGLTMNADGTISIAANIPPGTYVYPYTICSIQFTNICDNTTSTLKIISVIDAIQDNFGTVALGATTATVVTNDTLNTLPVTVGPGGNSSLTPGTSPDPNLIMNSDGTITVASNTEPGIYTYPYTICSNADVLICDTTNAILEVKPVIDAVNDAFGIVMLGDATVSVLVNDTLNTNQATTGAGGNVLLTPGVSPNAGLTMDVDGIITVATNTPPGTYSYPYKICSTYTATVCDNATATLTISPVINAVDDAMGNVSLGGNTPSVIDNDTLNNNHVTIGAGGNSTLTPGTSPDPEITMNADGTISVSLVATMGNYTYPYQICSVIDPTICDDAVATLFVAGEIDAVMNDFGNLALGASTTSVLLNDTLNNVLATVGGAGNVVLTPGTTPVAGLTMNADGTIRATMTVAPGTYDFPYEICAAADLTICDTSFERLRILSVIVAVPDNFTNITPGSDTTPVTGNDTLNGIPVVVGDGGNAILTPGVSPNPNIEMNTDGTITIGPKTPPGVYTYTYTICSTVDPLICSTNTVTLTVKSIIVADDDDYGLVALGTASPSVIQNDTLNSNPAVLGVGFNVTLTPGTSPEAGLTMNADGTISVATNAVPGIYQFPYKICSKVDVAVCDSANAVLIVPSIVNAIQDDFGTVDLGTTLSTPVANDKLNVNQAVLGATGNVSLTPGTSPNSNLTIDSQGLVKVGSSTPPGNYSYPYTICSIVDPLMCDSTIITFSIQSKITSHDDDLGKLSQGTNHINIFGNDNLNGNPITFGSSGNSTFTPGTSSDSRIVVNADGSVTIAPGLPKGNYTFTYTICSKVNPTVCSTSKVVLGIADLPTTGSSFILNLMIGGMMMVGLIGLIRNRKVKLL